MRDYASNACCLLVNGTVATTKNYVIREAKRQCFVLGRIKKKGLMLDRPSK